MSNTNAIKPGSLARDMKTTTADRPLDGFSFLLRRGCRQSMELRRLKHALFRCHARAQRGSVNNQNIRIVKATGTEHHTRNDVLKCENGHWTDLARAGPGRQPDSKSSDVRFAF